LLLISQALEIQRLTAFGERFPHEFLQFPTRPRIIEQFLPTCLVLLAQEETSEVRDLGAFILQQCLANTNEFLSVAAHVD